MIDASVKNLPGLMRYVIKNFDFPCALAFKSQDRWFKISTQTMGDSVLRIAAALRKMGLKAGDKVAIVSESTPKWLMMDMGILCAGGVSVPMFNNISPDNLRYQLEDSDTKFLFLGTAQEHSVMESMTGRMQGVICGEAVNDGKTVYFEDFLTQGKAALLQDNLNFDDIADAIPENELATIIYTSGSTGTPKGVELSHKNLISQVSGAAERFSLDPLTDKILSCLPLAHIFQRMVSYFYLSTGTSIFFSPDVKQLGDDLRELKPTVLTVVPRLLEKVFAKVKAKVEVEPGIKGKLARFAFQRAQEKNCEESNTLLDTALDAIVYGKMRQALGGKLRLVISGGSALSPKLANYFINIGIPIYEGYGLTEASPVIGVNYPGYRKVGTIGHAFPGVDVRVADDGEILAQGPNIMRGYHKKEAETKQMIDANGWLHTGDLGHIDSEGFIKITGRKKELFKTATGKYVAPVPIEFSLADNKLIDMAMVIAEGKKFASALVFADFENLKTFKAERGFAAQSDAAYLESEDAKNVVQEQIDQVNLKLNHWEQIRRFCLVKQPLTVEGGQLTPSMKIRRHIVEKMYKADIEAMYAEE